MNNWRNLLNPRDWQVTLETKFLLQHWRYYSFDQTRSFFLQLKAVEVLIWLTEVALKFKKTKIIIVEYLKVANSNANIWLDRFTLILVTGTGK